MSQRAGKSATGAALSSLLTLAGATALASVLTGCQTQAFCFDDCPGDTGSSASVGAGGGDGGVIISSSASGDCGIFGCSGTGGSGGAGCELTNGGVEICDGIDNDCNGTPDDGDINFASLKTCGNCATNCLEALAGCSLEGSECVPPTTAGQAGACKCNGCQPGFYDLDGDGKACEYGPCTPTATPETLCNNKDDDCDGVKDEELDFCSSNTDCGFCGNNCSILHGTPTCVHAGAGPCDATNTKCAVQSCTCNGPGDCWWDLDGVTATGCEYSCSITNGGVEICGDGIDNDCDGKIDAADDLAGDPQLGQVCYGDPDGECATAGHSGLTTCQGSQVVCTGANVLVENQVLETCNNEDDDCDGTVDDSPTDENTPCGTSNLFPCAFGLTDCQNGALVCLGAVSPQPESCNGLDDDCDGTIDKTGNLNPADATGPCNIPTPPPAGATSPCVAGTYACVGGTVQCQSAVGPSAPTDGCNVDANCDGTLTGQPNLQTDVHHCGNCATDCYTGAVHAQWACTAGGCVFQGCDPGYYDFVNAGDHKCETACVFVSAQESCNGVDDNCNGQVDEGVVAPSPVQVCGVSASATAAECKAPGVTVACQQGAWKCTFPAGVCNPTCATAVEKCDGLDNDCDGLINENTPNYGKPCASDDGLAAPGHGACRTLGTYACTGDATAACSAVKGSCAGVPGGGCTEHCDGIDNDCDGLVDETFNNKGTAAATYVKPEVIKIASSTWIYSYEASRPSATDTVPGTGNGFFTSAPSGSTIDKTPACSVSTKIPWFNVTPQEVEQTCVAMGGTICSTPNWQTACRTEVSPVCNYGYAPHGAGCVAGYTASKLCNLGPSFDFNATATGDQDGLLPTASPLLQNCWADWAGYQSNPATSNKLFDITGNLREITKPTSGTGYPLMGGAFDATSETGSACGFTFYSVAQTFKYYDTGFRCCFSADPR